MLAAWGAFPKEVQDALAEDEQPIAFTWARVPRRATRRGTFVSVHLVVGIVDMARSRADTKAIREQEGFPADRRMALCVTSKRLLIWRATGHPRRLGPLLGHVPRTQVVKADLPFVGGGRWRTVTLTGEKWRVSFQVERDAAEAFVQTFSG